MLVLRPLDVMKVLRISRFRFYQLVREKRIRTFKMGRAAIIKRDDFKAFLDALPEREIA
jgi:excisionase family DNA binding protein